MTLISSIVKEFPNLLVLIEKILLEKKLKKVLILTKIEAQISEQKKNVKK